MLIIPLPWNRELLEYLRDEYDLFDLNMKEGTQQSYIIVQDNTIMWLGQGTVPGKTAYQIKSRTICLGYSVSNDVTLGNVGFGGTFSSIDDAIKKKCQLNGYCINEMTFCKYRGQKLTSNKLHYNVIEPILALFSSVPSNSLRKLLQELGMKDGNRIACSGDWEDNLTLFIDGEVCSTIESWLIKFYMLTLPCEDKSSGNESEETTFKEKIFGVIGIIFIILILKSCLGG